MTSPATDHDETAATPPESTTQEPTPTSKPSLAVSQENLRDAPEGLEADWEQVVPKLRGAFRDAVRDATWPMYLWGPQGRGKTCAAAAFFRKVRSEPKWVDLQRFVRTVQRCRMSSDGKVYDFSQHGSSEGDVWRKFVETPELLVVDDVGIRGPSESVFEIVYELVNRRGKRPTIYTSNVPPKDLHRVYDGRVGSRMLSGVAVEITGEDRRLANLKSIRV